MTIAARALTVGPSIEAITTTAHQCSVYHCQGEPYSLPLIALIIAVKAGLGEAKAHSTEAHKSGIQGRKGCAVARGSQQTAAALHTAELCSGDMLGAGPCPSVTLLCQHHFAPQPGRFQPLPKETHLLCGS